LYKPELFANNLLLINQPKKQFMKTSRTELKKTPPTPVFQITIRKRVAKTSAAVSGPKSQKRDNIFSKSRDTREDRGTRQVKSTHNAQTLFRTASHLNP